MTSTGLLVELEAAPGKDEEVAEFLRSALPLVRQEPGTTTWFAVRFNASSFAIFDTFIDEAARSAHLSGPVATTLRERADELFAHPPEIHELDVLADKLPDGQATKPVSKGLLLTFEPKEGQEADNAEFLRSARAIVEEEPGTIAWFAIRLDDGRFGIFDAFPDNRSRVAHLTGRVPRELAKRGLKLLGGIPDMSMNSVLATTLQPNGAAHQRPGTALS
jgi:quinol monooxygenase YgiN